MQAVVMAGGRGERLHPLTLLRPKPLVPLFGRPLLDYLLRHLRAAGIDEVFVTAGHLGEHLAAFLAGQPGCHCRIETRPRGTAGAVADLLPALSSPFLVVSGDAIIDLDLAALEAAHRADGNLATLCLAPPAERLRFGTVATDGRRVTGFVEKPPLADLLPEARINTGCYLLQTDALADLAADGPIDFAMDVFPRLLAGGLPLGAIPAATFWRDIGTLEAYRDAHFDGLAGALPWAVPPQGAASLPPDVAVSGQVHVGAGVQFGHDVTLQGPVVLGDHCIVESGAALRRALLLDGCRIGAGAKVSDAVAGSGARVPAGCVVVGGAIAGQAALRMRRVRRPVPAATPANAEAPPPAAPGLAAAPLQ